MRDFSTSLNKDQAESHRDKSKVNDDGDSAYQKSKYLAAANTQEGARKIY